MTSLTFEDMRAVCRNSTEVYGRYFKAVCPFHQDNDPSMLVFKDGWFRCLGCGTNGRWETLWNKMKGQPVTVRAEKKTSWAYPDLRGLSLEEVCFHAHNYLIKFPSLGWYLEMRGVQDRIERNELGYWEGWYTIPVYDVEGNFITAVLRAAPHIQFASGMRYWCHHSPVPYVPDWRMMTKGEYVIVVYGMLDALTIASLRLPVITTTGGKDSFIPEWLDDYRKPIYIIPDLGEETTAIKLAGKLGWRSSVVRLNYPDGIKDPAGFAEAGKRHELEAQLTSLKGAVSHA